MRKKGYTLAEILITVGIIGILSAIMIPLANKYRPDADKATYLKTYDSLTSVVNNMINNSEIFPYVYIDPNGNETDVHKMPLFNTNKVPYDYDENGRFDNDEYIGGNEDKFCYILAESLKSIEFFSCKSTDYINGSWKDSSAGFRTDNNVQFLVKTELTPHYKTTLWIDVNGEKNGYNCLYDKNNCTTPDRFKFLIAADGTIIPADIMGRKYIQTRNYLKGMDYDSVILKTEPKDKEITDFSDIENGTELEFEFNS